MSNLEQIAAWFDAHSDDEFLEFERIEESQKRHPRPDLCALLYLHEKLGGTGDAITCAEHDEIWFDWEAEDITKLTEEDVIYLLRCGIRYDGGNESLCAFV